MQHDSHEVARHQGGRRYADLRPEKSWRANCWSFARRPRPGFNLEVMVVLFGDFQTIKEGDEAATNAS